MGDGSASIFQVSRRQTDLIPVPNTTLSVMAWNVKMQNTVNYGDDGITTFVSAGILNLIEFTTIPKPATIMLLGFGSLTFVARRRR